MKGYAFHNLLSANNIHGFLWTVEVLSGSEALLALYLLGRYSLSIYERDIILHDRFLSSFLLFVYKSIVLL